MRKKVKEKTYKVWKKMDAMRQPLPRLQLTVPMPIKTGKVGLTFYISGCCVASSHEGGNKLSFEDGKNLEVNMKVFNRFTFPWYGCSTFVCEISR